MKVALLHDWLTGFRGGERVLEVFCELYPDSDLHTLIYKPGSTSNIIENRAIKTSFLNHIPAISTHYRKFLPLFPLAVDFMELADDTDLIISSHHCVIKGLAKPTGSKHLCYIHSPMRYMYDQYDAYFGKQAPLYQQIGAKIFKNSIIDWDLKSNDNVDLFVANSAFVKNRVNEFYQRDAEVIHPFVELSDFKKIQSESIDKEDYFIIVSAFAPNKRLDLAIETFNQLKLKLKIIGSGQQEQYLRSLAGPTIEFLGHTDRQSLISCFAKARALIFPGVEDFGITPLESLASVTPVIAFNRGGVLETLDEDVAVFFNEQTVESLKDAVQRFERSNFNKSKLIDRANCFSREIFKKKMNDLIASFQ